MDLIKCPVCGELYSPSYRRCPFCEELKGGRKRRGGHRVSDKKHTYSARGALIVILILVLGLLSWYLFGDKLLALFGEEEPPAPPVEEQTPQLPDNEDLFFDPNAGDEPNIGGEETPNAGDAPVIDPPVVEDPVVDEPTVDVENIVLNRSDFTLSIGENFRLKSEPEVEGIVWSVKDGSVVSVTEEGLVTGLSKGKTTIYAKIGDRTLECVVFVRAATAASDADVSNAALSKNDFTLSVGERYTVKVTGTTATPKWSIDDSSIASISSDGTIKALKKGHTNFYAKVGDKTLKGIVFVK
ncbi:MAG: Ig-like domain-containing protein [Oscillospiraceae bacterium]|nr:Ig-like domain-containing protein [Oscillospiraceae bacterium]